MTVAALKSDPLLPLLRRANQSVPGQPIKLKRMNTLMERKVGVNSILVAALHNQLAADGIDVAEFIGRFRGVNNLPKWYMGGDYPPIYCWYDSSIDGIALRVSYNIPRLKSVCKEQCDVMGIPASEEDVDAAVEFYRQVSLQSLASVLQEIRPPLPDRDSHA